MSDDQPTTWLGMIGGATYGAAGIAYTTVLGSHDSSWRMNVNSSRWCNV